MKSHLTEVLDRLKGSLPTVIRRRYAAKFGLALFAIVIVMSAAGAFIHFDTKAVVEQQTEEEIRGIAESEARSVADWTESKESSASFLASGLADRPATTTSVDHNRWLEQKLIELPSDVRSLNYVNVDTGSVVASTDDEMSGQSLDSLDEPWTDGAASLASSSASTISAPYTVNNEPVVAFVAPVTGRDGFVVLTASLTARSHEFKSPIATGDVKVISSDGTILLDNRKASILEQYTASGSDSVTEIEAALNGQSGYEVVTTRTGMDSGNYAMAYTPITGTDWVLTYHVPSERAFALQSEVSQNLVVLLVFAIGSLFVVGVTVGRGTAKSLATIAQNADKIANGEVDGEVPSTTRIDEMGRLYNSFAEMQSYLTTVAGQAEALAAKEFDDPILEEEVPGSFGAAISQTHTDLEGLIVELETKTEEFSDAVAAAAKGDLTRRLPEDADNEAMREMAQSFNEMASELEATIVEVTTFAETVTAASEEVTASAREIEHASRDVGKSTQGMRQGAHEQQATLQQTTGETSNLSATIEEVASSANELERSAEHTLDASEAGYTAAVDAIDTIKHVESRTTQTATRIEELETHMDEIGDIVGLITTIAEQTNLLALNANIEAARAGHEGKGFAVVANEVKELAGETKESAEDIEATIETVQSKSLESAEEIRETRDAVDSGVAAVKNARDELDSIVENVRETKDGAEDISRATDEQAVLTEEVAAMMDNATEISEETANRAETVATATEEQTASLGEISDGTDQLASRAEQLMALVSSFTVSSDRTETTSSSSIDESRADAAPASPSESAVTDGGDTPRE